MRFNCHFSSVRRPVYFSIISRPISTDKKATQWLIYLVLTSIKWSYQIQVLNWSNFSGGGIVSFYFLRRRRPPPSSTSCWRAIITFFVVARNKFLSCEMSFDTFHATKLEKKLTATKNREERRDFGSVGRSDGRPAITYARENYLIWKWKRRRFWQAQFVSKRDIKSEDESRSLAR